LAPTLTVAQTNLASDHLTEVRCASQKGRTALRLPQAQWACVVLRMNISYNGNLSGHKEHVKITGIDRRKTQPDHLVFFKTEPALTLEVFNEFMSGMETQGFSITDDLLVWGGPVMTINPEFIRQAEERLTKAETTIKTEKARIEEQDDAFLEKISAQTGLPVI